MTVLRLLLVTAAFWTAMGLVTRRRGGRITVPLLFAAWLLAAWQIAVRGFDIPPVLLPAPGDIAAAIGEQAGVLWIDFRQTFLKSALAGFIAGNAAGFLGAVLADRSDFLRRGLVPLAGLASVMPIIGVAPIMVMWFGFDWESKAAVVTVLTVFPMFLGAVAGLRRGDRLLADLMRTYAAGYWESLVKLRLPQALPFIFNALKINASLALIGAVVAEFFGSPTAGFGFRISVEVARMDIAVVWASISVAALTAFAFYGAIAGIERRLTFWHPSYRGQP